MKPGAPAVSRQPVSRLFHTNGNHIMSRRACITLSAVLALAACADSSQRPDPSSPLLPTASLDRSRANDAHDRTGDVYVMTNAAEGNAVLAFHRAANGSLQGPKTFATGGRGSGRPRLSSQGPVLLSKDGEKLFVANVGSSDISVFDVTNAGLRLVERTPSGGVQPFSLTIRGNLLYVLNRGSEADVAPANVTAFTVSEHGTLTPLVGSTRLLSTAYPDPAQVSFTPDGQTLVVTEKATNKIDTYALGQDGRAISATPAVHASSGITPFGFDFTRNGVFVVTEAFGGAPGAAAASSYSLASGFGVLSASVKDTEAEVCWTAISSDDRYAYVTNFGTGSISSYSIHADGRITLLQAVAGRTENGLGPRDEDFSADGRYLYVLDIGLTEPSRRGVHAFRLEQDGRLTALGIAPFPESYPTVAGLAAR